MPRTSPQALPRKQRTPHPFEQNRWPGAGDRPDRKAARNPAGKPRHRRPCGLLLEVGLAVLCTDRCPAGAKWRSGLRLALAGGPPAAARQVMWSMDDRSPPQAT